MDSSVTNMDNGQTSGVNLKLLIRAFDAPLLRKLNQPSMKSQEGSPEGHDAKSTILL